jgi:opacity protein-like surface antigen
MKALIIAAASAAALAASASAASAQTAGSGWYVRGDAGATFDSRIDQSGGPRSDSGWTVGAGVGKDLGNGLRAEGEFVYLDNNGKHSSGDIKTTAGFLNGYYDFARDTAWRPFIGAGIGLAQVKVDGGGLADGDDTGFAYQFKAGVAHPITDQLTGELAYRYLGVKDVQIGSGPGRIDGDYTTSAVTVGLRYSF